MPHDTVLRLNKNSLAMKYDYPSPESPHTAWSHTYFDKLHLLFTIAAW